MRRRRQGFTLVELLVAMALIMFIMAIMSQAFVTATQTFRDLKSAADSAEKLRATTNIMRRYLASDHFEAKRRLSDPNFWQGGPPREGFFRVWHGSPSTFEGADPDGNPSFLSTSHALHFSVKLRGTQRNSYFATIVPFLPSPPNPANTPSPLPGLPVTATPSSYQVSRTPPWQFVWQAQPETRYEDYPAAGGSVYNWQWAEVAFFLQPTGDNANGTPLYGLYMRTLLAVPDTGSGTMLGVSASQRVPSQQSQVPGYLEVSCQSDPSGATSNLYFNSPIDLTMPVRRFGMTPGATSPTNYAGVPLMGGISPTATYPRYADETTGNITMAAADLLLANVISFDVRLLTAQPPTPGQKGPTPPYPSTGSTLTPGNWDAFEDLFQLTNTNRLPNSYLVTNPSFSTSGPLVFDTWSNNRDDTYDYTSWMTLGTPASIPILNNTQGGQINIRAVQVTLRIWDEKTQMTRQVTFVQEL